ncbi:MAG: hypothetical protein U5J63_10120 [Fodinibius sp.]|nr:hypothetical protein [Fodinibius sp.]
MLTGTFFSSDDGFTLSWQLLETATKTIFAGDTVLGTVPRSN